MTLLAQLQMEKEAGWEELRVSVRGRLKSALGQLLPGQACWIYGSLNKPGCFRDWSDVDLALESEPPAMSIYRFSSLMAERVGRPVDVVLLDETRLAGNIQREGERWIG